MYVIDTTNCSFFGCAKESLHYNAKGNYSSKSLMWMFHYHRPQDGGSGEGGREGGKERGLWEEWRLVGALYRIWTVHVLSCMCVSQTTVTGDTPVAQVPTACGTTPPTHIHAGAQVRTWLPAHIINCPDAHTLTVCWVDVHALCISESLWTAWANGLKMSPYTELCMYAICNHGVTRQLQCHQATTVLPGNHGVTKQPLHGLHNMNCSVCLTKPMTDWCALSSENNNSAINSACLITFMTVNDAIAWSHVGRWQRGQGGFWTARNEVQHLKKAKDAVTPSHTYILGATTFLPLLPLVNSTNCAIMAIIDTWEQLWLLPLIPLHKMQ